MQLKTLPIIRHNSKPLPAATSNSAFFKCIDFIFSFFSNGVGIIGPTFVVSVSIFIVIISNSFFTTILPYWFISTNYFTCLVLLLLSLFIWFQIIFNYTLAVAVKPGGMEDIIQSKRYWKLDPLQNSTIRFESVLSNKLNIECGKTVDIKGNNLLNNMTINAESCIPRIAKKTSNDNNNDNKDDNNNACLINNKQWPECRYCLKFKPIRAHHCSVCKRCVFKMDHHCPWINNCIGQNNQRYFTLFLLYIQIGTFFVIVVALPLWLNPLFHMKGLFLYVSLLDVFAFLIASYFSLWQFSLIFQGRTTIEYWSIKNNINTKGLKLVDFSFYDWRENMYLVFGTKSLLKALLVPSVKMLKYSGLEWTKIVYPDFELKDVAYYAKMQ